MEPKLSTLQEAIVYFSNPTNCRNYVADRRWPKGVECPRCGNKKVTFLEKYNRWQCGARHANRQFTAKTGTIFEDSPLGLDKWLAAMWQVVNCKNGVSSYEVHRAIRITQKSAWFMDHRIRLALQVGSLEKLGGPGSEVEADEAVKRGTCTQHVGHNSGLLGRLLWEMRLWSTRLLSGAFWTEKSRRVRATVVPKVNREALQTAVLDQVAPGSKVYTDEAKVYRALPKDYIHEFVNHMESYVNGQVHTNGLENFWSLLKRTLSGTYVAVEPFHLHRYLDEQMFRYNHRKNMDDGQRFDLAVRQIHGKRLTWAELTGKASGSTIPTI
jgi:hypothetical protein